MPRRLTTQHLPHGPGPSVTVALTMVLVLGGCLGPKLTPAMRKSPDYHAGYHDGCASAPGPDANWRAGFTPTKDEALFKKSRNYRAGWNSGFTACRTYTPRGVPRPYAGPIPDENPGNGGIPRP